MSKEEKITEMRIDASNSPSAMLAAVAAAAPEPVKNYLESCAEGVLVTELPKLKMCMSAGPTIESSKIPVAADVFTQAMERLDERGATHHISMTVRDCALSLAEVIDKAIKRVLLEDEIANRLAVMDLVGLHARFVSTLSDVALTDVQLQAIAEMEAGNDDAS